MFDDPPIDARASRDTSDCVDPRRWTRSANLPNGEAVSVSLRRRLSVKVMAESSLEIRSGAPNMQTFRKIAISPPSLGIFRPGFHRWFRLGEIYNILSGSLTDGKLSGSGRVPNEV
ncbi:MAG TPA: hypothetical protein VLS45_06905 [Methylomicrobium sp.]|nr:hypothetical protein [Methylomicrobium sp.]